MKHELPHQQNIACSRGTGSIALERHVAYTRVVDDPGMVAPGDETESTGFFVAVVQVNTKREQLRQNGRLRLDIRDAGAHASLPSGARATGRTRS